MQLVSAAEGIELTRCEKLRELSTVQVLTFVYLEQMGLVTVLSVVASNMAIHVHSRSSGTCLGLTVGIFFLLSHRIYLIKV